MKTTAKDFIWDKYWGREVPQNEIPKLMIDFTKTHMKDALEEIYEKAKHGDEEHQKWLKEFFDNHSLENIV